MMTKHENKLESSLEKLEVKVAFLEDALNRLSDEHYLQQKELDQLKSQYVLVSERLRKELDKGESFTQIEDERPPHY